MKDYYDMSEEERKDIDNRGIDYDLRSCIEYNINEYGIFDIESVLALWEGEHDGDDWRWILKLKDGRIAFLQGGCDYTGWDCQSWARTCFANSLEEAANFALSGPIEATFEEAVVGMGLGRLIAAFSGTYMSNAQDVFDDINRQLKEGKDTSWREKKDKELEVSSLPKIK